MRAQQGMEKPVAAKPKRDNRGSGRSRKGDTVSEMAQADQEKYARSADRTLVLHYHLFKNAGTSVDAILRTNFGSRWSTREFAQRGWQPNVKEVSEHLRAQPHLRAFSSHTARLPAPMLEGVHVFPILFLRHPIDRLRSAYRFERMQTIDTPGSRLAKSNSLGDYLRILMAIPGHRQARNFQTQRLAFNEPSATGSERERALRALELLPFVGLVDEYDCSIDRLQSLLRPFVPNFRAVHVHMNATRELKDTVDEKISEIKDEIGATLFAELCAANEDDLFLYKALKKKFSVTSKPAALPQAARIPDMPPTQPGIAAASTVRALRALLTELDSVVTSMETRAAGCELSDDPLVNQIVQKLVALNGRIDPGLATPWRDEGRNAGIPAVDPDIGNAGPREPASRGRFVDGLRKMLSLLSRTLESASE